MLRGVGLQTLGGSYHNLAALEDGSVQGVSGPSMSSFGKSRTSLLSASRTSMDSQDTVKQPRIIIVSNQLPVRAKKKQAGEWEFEWDEDALVAQAKDGIPDEYEVIYIGSLPVDVDIMEQEKLASDLKKFNCCPVFMAPLLREKFYKGFCKQQLWPLFHYVLPTSPHSSGRFNSELWQAYVKANKVFTDKLIEELVTDTDYVWIHDYHLLVMPSLIRRRFHRIRIGLFLHSPFPSSEIFRTFPKREEILRSLLNADLLGFHTFDYARHFLSCCSRMLGLEHETSRGSIIIDYYGRAVGIKIMPTGVNPSRLLSGFEWHEFKWRRGELTAQFKDCMVLIGVDDMDAFKGIEMKLQAFESVLDAHADWRGRLVLVQITNPPRHSSKDLLELHSFVIELVQRINAKYGTETYQPVVYLERHVPLHERIAFYSVADCAIITATRDGMNLVPYEYVVCRQGPDNDPDSVQDSMLVLSEFVGCSPSLSGAIRVNPWSVDSVADGMYSAIKMPLEHRRLRHKKHWRYVSEHTVTYWAASYVNELSRVTKGHSTMRCYGLGLGLDTFRMVALDANFKKLDDPTVQQGYNGATTRAILLDYDGTLIPQSSISCAPVEEVLGVLRTLADDPSNRVYIVSGRCQAELQEWFSSVENVGLAAEHGFYFKPAGSAEWETLNPHADFSWKDIALPIFEQYRESTDGSWIEVKESALVWHYRDADPDFGNWQAKELLDHLEDVLSNKPVEVVSGASIVEVKPQGVTKGLVVERILTDTHSVTASAAEAGASSEPSTSSTSPIPDFVLCIGDDRSDEDMFTTVESVSYNAHKKAEVFACTVGQKPSRAPYYLNDPNEVVQLLAKLASVALPSDFASSPHSSFVLPTDR